MGRSISSFLMVGVLLIVVTGVGWADTAGDLARAEELAQGGQYDAAIGLLSGISTSDPGLASRVGTLLARCYLSTKNSSTALAKYQELIKDYPNATQAAEWNRGTAECYVSMSKFSECFVALDKAIELATDPAVKRMYRADRAFIIMAGSRKSDLALTEYQALLEDYPDAPAEQVAGWYRGMGECYVSMNKLQECDAALSKAIELVKDPAIKMVYRGDRAFLLLIGNDYARALAEYQALENEHWDGPEQAKLMLGICYQRNGDNERALSILRDLQANSKDPEMVKDAMLNSCDCLCQPGKVDEALAMLDKSYEEHTDWRADILLEKGQVLAVYKQDYALALDTYKQLIADFADCRFAKQAMVNIGTITLWNLWKPAEARTIFTDLLAKAGTLGLDEAELLYHLAYCSYVEKNYLGALGEFQSLCDTYPDSSFSESALYMVGDCSVRIGDSEGARNAFSKVISDFPGTDLATHAQERLASLASIKKPESQPVADTKVAQLEKQEGHINETK